ncbi:MAG: YIP1 family protein [Desulfonatronovibrionaceae bacterium]
MNAFVDRMIRAAKLDPGVYEEVEADRGAMGQAMGVVVLSGLAAGVGMIGTQGMVGIIFGTVAALLGWYIWAFLTYFIGVKLLPESQTESDYGELLRTIGFSSSPGIIRVAGVIPALQGIVSFVAGIWMLIAMVIAVRQALDYTSTFRAVGVCIIGWLVQMLLIAAVFALVGGFGGTAPAP